MQNKNYVFYEYTTININVWQKNNKTFTEIANTQIHDKVYFWKTGKELNMGRV